MVKLLMSNCVVNSLIVLLSFCQLIESYSSSGSEYSKGNKNVEGLSSGSSGLKEKSRRQVSISPASRSSIITSKFDNKGSSPSASSLRFPRSDPNYVRNFLYTSRGGGTSFFSFLKDYKVHARVGLIRVFSYAQP